MRAEIISKHWDIATIIERSNVMRTSDVQYAQAAAELLKQDSAAYRIEVASDTLSMTDFDALKGDRVEFLQATAAFMQQIAAIGATAPQAVPFLLEFLKHGVSGFRGAAQLEGVLDRMISTATQAAQQAMAPKPPPPPDPRLQAQQAKAQADVMKAKADVQKTQIGLQTAKIQGVVDLQKAKAEVAKAQFQAMRPPPINMDPGAPQAE
jgi:hypothetical protein